MLHTTLPQISASASERRTRLRQLICPSRADMSKNQRSSKPWILPAADVVDVGFLEDVQPADITGQAQISARLKAEQKRRGFGDSYQANECGYNRSTLQDFLSGRRVWEDDECAFLKRYITYSESKKSEAALKAAYEKANKGQKPDWRTSMLCARPVRASYRSAAASATAELTRCLSGEALPRGSPRAMGGRGST